MAGKAAGVTMPVTQTPAAGSAPNAPAAAAAAAPAGAPAGAFDWQTPALGFLAAATVAELLLQRVLTRVGVFIPKTPAMVAGYRLLADAGSVAFNLSLLLTLILLPGALRRRPVAIPATLLVVLPLAGLAGPGWSLAAGAVMAATVAWLGLAAARAAGGRWAAAGVLAVAGAHLAWYGATAAQLGLSLAGRPGWPGAAALLRGGELLALAAPVLLALAAGMPGRSPAGPPGRSAAGAQAAAGARAGALLGVALAGGFAAAYLAQPDLAGVLAIWSLGFTLSWPAPLYALALAAAGYALVRTAGAGAAGRRTALGLGLIFLAGYAPQLNQQHLLVLLGYTMLVPPAAPRRS